jgi:hypothetical protein
MSIDFIQVLRPELVISSLTFIEVCTVHVRILADYNIEDLISSVRYDFWASSVAFELVYFLDHKVG